MPANNRLSEPALNEDKNYLLMHLGMHVGDKDALNRPFRTLSRTYHPDRNPTERDKATEYFQKWTNIK